MSTIFGIVRCPQKPVWEHEIQDLARTTERYAPDGLFVNTDRGLGMGFQPYHTHERSHLESQPAIDCLGNMLVLDGRLDNHAELRQILGLVDADTPDSKIMLAAFEHWGEECFSHFIGDWALALWVTRDRSLYLARDHAGTRTLYFEQTGDRLIWSTFLETFFWNGRSICLDIDFGTRYLACLPLHDLTPYQFVKAVPPAHFLCFRGNKITPKPHWQWIVRDSIRYNSDGEYEDHFRSLFRQSVERRTGKGAPILAHLSGGMDSGSIVCMSDQVRREESARPEDLLDTISYFDDSEPHWNEKPYFTLIEDYRGKRGIHVRASSADRTLDPLSFPYLLPGPDSTTYKREQNLIDLIGERGYRTILSGYGGDECFGGVPTCLPELADYLRSGEISQLVRSGIARTSPRDTTVDQ
jgi:asparagine synthase (glutamine-hydrolysing)